MASSSQRGAGHFHFEPHFNTMANLHLSRVAYGCSDYAALAARIQERGNEQGEIQFTTRNRPKQATELIGGGLYFIVKYMMMARLEIVRFDDREDGRIDIVCKLPLQRVRPTPKRAHQGWRYLQQDDAPEPVVENEAEDELPPHLLRDLSALMLI